MPFSYIDDSGNLVVKYNYDAYGNSKGYTDSSGMGLGSMNPFRYKGYYYDSDTNMYYCKSRYYVPEWCRWLNGDHIGYLDIEELNGMNLFSYCGNNPITCIDGEGNFFGIGFAIVFGLSALFAMASVTMSKPEVSVSITSKIEKGLASFGEFATDLVTQTITNISIPYLLAFAALDNVMMSKQTGNQRDNGLAKQFPDTPEGNEALEQARKQAHKNGDTQLERRIVKEQKARGLRNKRKNRGGPNMKSMLYLLFLNEIIRRF